MADRTIGLPAATVNHLAILCLCDIHDRTKAIAEDIRLSASPYLDRERRQVAADRAVRTATQRAQSRHAYKILNGLSPSAEMSV